MTKEDVEEHIREVAEGEKTTEARLHCNHCGTELTGDDYVTWEIDATPAAGVGGATEYFCDGECKDTYKQAIIRGER